MSIGKKNRGHGRSGFVENAIVLTFVKRCAKTTGLNSLVSGVNYFSISVLVMCI